MPCPWCLTVPGWSAAVSLHRRNGRPQYRQEGGVRVRVARPRRLRRVAPRRCCRSVGVSPAQMPCSTCPSASMVSMARRQASKAGQVAQICLASGSVARLNQVSGSARHGRSGTVCRFEQADRDRGQ